MKTIYDTEKIHRFPKLKTLASTEAKYSCNIKFQNILVSAEAGGHLLAVHSVAPPPPRALRGDHRPQIQQVCPANELGNLRLALPPPHQTFERLEWYKDGNLLEPETLFSLPEDSVNVAKGGSGSSTLPFGPNSLASTSALAAICYKDISLWASNICYHETMLG